MVDDKFIQLVYFGYFDLGYFDLGYFDQAKRGINREPQSWMFYYLYVMNLILIIQSVFVEPPPIIFYNFLINLVNLNQYFCYMFCESDMLFCVTLQYL